MTDQIDIYRSAQVPIREHGADAPIHAAMMADKMLERGDLDGLSTWKRILRPIELLQSTGHYCSALWFVLSGYQTGTQVGTLAAGTGGDRQERGASPTAGNFRKSGLFGIGRDRP